MRRIQSCTVQEPMGENQAQNRLQRGWETGIGLLSITHPHSKLEGVYVHISAEYAVSVSVKMAVFLSPRSLCLSRLSFSFDDSPLCLNLLLCDDRPRLRRVNFIPD